MCFEKGKKKEKKKKKKKKHFYSSILSFTSKKVSKIKT